MCVLQAWMRARGDASGSVFTADTIADKYGVVKGSYTSVALPNTESHQASASVLFRRSWRGKHGPMPLSAQLLLLLLIKYTK